MYSLVHYCDSNDRDLFAGWLDAVPDVKARARVAARLLRLENGNFGDCRFVGEGVWELRIDWGPGYRVYYAIAGRRVVLLCHGGDKRTQRTDIKKAQERHREWMRRMKDARSSQTR